MEKQVIKEFRYYNNFLSNFSRDPVLYRDILFKTSEHAYQWAKCETEDDRLLILSCDTPTEVKKYGHLIKCDINEWDHNKVNVMEEILRCKFSNENLKKKLLNTGDAELIEGNYWCDRFWGKCYCPRCKNKEGKNYLGKTLMKIRDEFLT
jgi:ribA/ribD-fused uncharacterized protein